MLEVIVKQNATNSQYIEKQRIQKTSYYACEELD